MLPRGRNRVNQVSNIGKRAARGRRRKAQQKNSPGKAKIHRGGGKSIVVGKPETPAETRLRVGCRSHERGNRIDEMPQYRGKRDLEGNLQPRKINQRQLRCKGSFQREGKVG